MTSTQPNTSRGFTIIELLVVIVVVGVLAAITLVSFNGIQAKARDSQRLQDVKSIVKALELYKTQNGRYPDEVGTVGAGGWEISSDGTNATNFLSLLATSSTASKIPVDPKNTAPSGLDPGNASPNFTYFYHLYGAGASGCPVARGDFYVFGMTRMETVPSGGIHSTSPGFACSGQDWGAIRGAWVTGSYTN